jgi:hypothetical protein
MNQPEKSLCNQAISQTILAKSIIEKSLCNQSIGHKNPCAINQSARKFLHNLSINQLENPYQRNQSIDQNIPVKQNTTAALCKHS